MLALITAIALAGIGSGMRQPGIAPDQAKVAELRIQLSEERDPEKRVQLVLKAIATRGQEASFDESGNYQILLGDAYCGVKKIEEARTAYRAAEGYIDTLGDRPKVDALNLIARRLYMAEDRSGSVYFLEQALMTAKGAEFARDVAEIGFNLGATYSNKAEQDVTHMRAAEDAASAGLPKLSGELYAELAFRGFENSDYERAIHYWEKAMAIPEWNEPAYREATEHYLLVSCGYSGDWRRAQKYGPVVYKRYKAQGELSKAAMSLNDIAYAQMSAQRFDAAIAGFKQALTETPVDNKVQRAQISFNLGTAFEGSKAWTEAIKRFEAAKLLVQKSDPMWANSELSVGLGYLMLGKPARALESFKAASGKDLGDGGLVNTLGLQQGMSRCYRLLGRKKEADELDAKLHEYLLEELGNREILRMNPYTRDLFGEPMSFDAMSRMYSLCVAQDIRQGDLSGAFTLADRSKARSLVDIELQAKVDWTKISALEVDNKLWLLTHATRLQLGSSKLPADRARVEQRVAIEVLSNYEAAVAQKHETVESRLSQAGDDRLDQFNNVVKNMAALPPDTVFLEFVPLKSLVDDEVAVLMAWSEGGITKLAKYTIGFKGKPLTIAELTALADGFGRTCRSRISKEPDRGSVVKVESAAGNNGDRLRQVVYEPMRERLLKFKRIVIATDESIEQLPFEALPIGDGQRMIDRWEISYCYSARQWVLSNRAKVTPDPEHPQLVVANPKYGTAGIGANLPLLPGTQLEADRIKQVVPGADLLTGADAKLSAAYIGMRFYSMLHFATHGLLDSIHPLGSSLALSETEDMPGASPLSAYEIQGTTLKARVAVLSACDTGRGEFRRGQGTIGLTFAFLKAGCPVVISSRWPVSDKAAPDLMGSFYQALSQQQSLGAALRTAILETKKKYPEPYYWAPFMLVGDSRK